TLYVDLECLGQLLGNEEYLRVGHRLFLSLNFNRFAAKHFLETSQIGTMGRIYENDPITRWTLHNGAKCLGEIVGGINFYCFNRIVLRPSSAWAIANNQEIVLAQVILP